MKNLTESQKEAVHIGGRKHVQPEQVMMLVADSNYTTIYLADGNQFMIATTIGKIQKILENYGQFIRPNKSHVVNCAFVKSSNSEQIFLKNNKVVRFSRRREKEIRPI